MVSGTNAARVWSRMAAAEVNTGKKDSNAE